MMENFKPAPELNERAYPILINLIPYLYDLMISFTLEKRQ